MSLDDFAINFSGLTHDHSHVDESAAQVSQSSARKDAFACSTIAILRRHPMYDCLVLVKKFRKCLDGYSLEFPSDTIEAQNMQSSKEELNEGVQNLNPATSTMRRNCSRSKLVSKFLDGDDPMYQSCCINGGIHGNQPPASEDPSGQQTGYNLATSTSTSSPSCQLPQFAAQYDDNGDQCEIVHVPINGLLDRLKNYTQSGVAVDSRVYAFAMGLKTAERILTTSSMKELQETPLC